MRISNNIIFALTLICMLISISINLSTYNLFNEQRPEEFLGKATNDQGTVSICLNTLPVISNHTCNFTSLEANFVGLLKRDYRCKLGAYDPTNETVTYEAYNPWSAIDVWGNVTMSGNISIYDGETTPDNITLSLLVRDISQCDNNFTEFNITYPMTYTGQVLFIGNYPSIETDRLELESGFTTVHLPLDDFFIDTDGFPLTYTYTYFDIHCYDIELIIENNTNIVTYTPRDGFHTEVTGPCRARFTATNPYGVYNISNIFYIDVLRKPTEEQPPEDQQDQDQKDKSGGGGGGGGAAASSKAGGSGKTNPPKDCILKNVNCTEWSACTYHYPNTTEIMFYDRTHDGLKTRSCTWQTNCPGEIAPAQKEVCDYVPSCDDDLLNCHEVGFDEFYCEEKVDCGGPCDPCPTCFDGVKNQDETGVDCGGSCAECSTCNDGVRNCIKMENGTVLCEEQVDCGGPCVPCATCEDRIRNCHTFLNGTVSCEEGIDCGGPCENSCSEEQEPAIVTVFKWISLLVILAIIVAIIVAIRLLYPKLYEYYQKKYMDKIKAMILKARQAYDRNYLAHFNKQIKLLQENFDDVTAEQAKAVGDQLLMKDETTGYNIDRYSVSFDSDYADILTDNETRTINYAMYLNRVEHGQRVLKEIEKLGLHPNYKVCKRSSSVQWDPAWKKDPNAKYEMVGDKTIARTVEYILSFTPKDQDEAKKIIKVLELYGKGREMEKPDAWDVPDIRVTGDEPLVDFEKHILNTKSVAGQKLIVLTKDKVLPGYNASTLWLNPGLAKFIK